MKQQVLIRIRLGRWLSVIDLLLERFEGTHQNIERGEGNDLMATIIGCDAGLPQFWSDALSYAGTTCSATI